MIMRNEQSPDGDIIHCEHISNQLHSITRS
uniref:Uncharacterized protein n=1 Tax=Arundo donax TaxID=35708 RepID=A0A0A9HNB4_ARUDO